MAKDIKLFSESILAPTQERLEAIQTLWDNLFGMEKVPFMAITALAFRLVEDGLESIDGEWGEFYEQACKSYLALNDTQKMESDLPDIAWELNEVAELFIEGKIRSSFDDKAIIQAKNDADHQGLQLTQDTVHGLMLSNGYVNPIEYIEDLIENDIGFDAFAYWHFVSRFLKHRKLSSDDLSELSKEQVWSLLEAVIYAHGLKSNGDMRVDMNTVLSERPLKKLFTRARDAGLIGSLKIYDLDKEPKTRNFFFENQSMFALLGSGQKIFDEVSGLYVTPYAFKAWLEDQYPDYWLVAKPSTLDDQVPLHIDSLSTMQLKLLSDAWDKFWSTYDPQSPTAKIPLKKSIMSWLADEYAKRGGGKLSDNIAGALDSYLRPESASKGGNRAFFE